MLEIKEEEANKKSLFNNYNNNEKGTARAENIGESKVQEHELRGNLRNNRNKGSQRDVRNNNGLTGKGEQDDTETNTMTDIQRLMRHTR